MKDCWDNELQDLHDKYEYASCLNEPIDYAPKFIIIGSITPNKGNNNGNFFYMSPSNQMYEIIDYCLNNESNFREMQLAGNVSGIKEALRKYQIAFFDVVKECIRPKRDARDKAILVKRLISADEVGLTKSLCVSHNYSTIIHIPN